MPRGHKSTRMRLFLCYRKCLLSFVSARVEMNIHRSFCKTRVLPQNRNREIIQQRKQTFRIDIFLSHPNGKPLYQAIKSTPTSIYLFVYTQMTRLIALMAASSSALTHLQPPFCSRLLNSIILNSTHITSYHTLHTQPSKLTFEMSKVPQVCRCKSVRIGVIYWH